MYSTLTCLSCPLSGMVQRYLSQYKSTLIYVEKNSNWSSTYITDLKMAALSHLFLTYKGEINLLQLRLMLMLVQASLLEISVKAYLILDLFSSH